MNDWPKDRWVALLQGFLTGTACKVYDSLSAEDSSNYDLVKDCILMAYERTPEFYRQQFRGYKKQANQREFGREKEQFFDRWCHSQQINGSYGHLKQLLLLEEFKTVFLQNLKSI